IESNGEETYKRQRETPPYYEGEKRLSQCDMMEYYRMCRYRGFVLSCSPMTMLYAMHKSNNVYSAMEVAYAVSGGVVYKDTYALQVTKNTYEEMEEKLYKLKLATKAKTVAYKKGLHRAAEALILKGKRFIFSPDGHVTYVDDSAREVCWNLSDGNLHLRVLNVKKYSDKGIIYLWEN
ncbi:hypothetical protein, partial [Fangia hongkongensis]|uniref:hypothetical protein n=2 Tax=Fangia hongkongensis TaxID=270495 RepID=UPI001F1EE903